MAASELLGARNLALQIASGEELSVRHFAVQEAMSAPFEVAVVARSESWDIDFEANIGRPATFQLVTGLFGQEARIWRGVCSRIEQLEPEPDGLSTYRVTIVPAIWLLHHRRNHRIFQHLTVAQIVRQILSEHGVESDEALTLDHPERELRVQYGESDFAFVSRLLEDEGISYAFEVGAEGMRVILVDEPHRADPQQAVPFVGEPNPEAGLPFVTEVRIGRAVRPTRVTLRDHDLRRPGFALFGAASVPDSDDLEQYSYEPGAFLVKKGDGVATPAADDQGGSRHDEAEGAALAERRLHRARRGRRVVSFRTNVAELLPGAVFSIGGHPHPELHDANLVVTRMTLEGAHDGDWSLRAEACFAADPLVPEQTTPKPSIRGVQSAVVVGPPGEEIHTDEFGRVRVQFPWDREGQHDDHSSCWIRVSQPWAGAGYGAMVVPRVGQEVLVGFFEGDPDQPVVVGRFYNGAQVVPYPLPDQKIMSGWKSNSSPGGNGFNEIRFDDTQGAELLYVQAQRDLEKLVKHDETERTGVAQTVVVGAQRSSYVGTTDVTYVGQKYAVQMMAPPTPELLGIAAQAMPQTSPIATGLEMLNERVGGTTGKAHFAIYKSDIGFEAKGNIGIKAEGNIVVRGGPNVHINPRRKGK